VLRNTDLLTAISNNNSLKRPLKLHQEKPVLIITYVSKYMQVLLGWCHCVTTYIELVSACVPKAQIMCRESLQSMVASRDFVLPGDGFLVGQNP
jgi:hypothetical protein